MPSQVILSFELGAEQLLPSLLVRTSDRRGRQIGIGGGKACTELSHQRQCPLTGRISAHPVRSISDLIGSITGSEDCHRFLANILTALLIANWGWSIRAIVVLAETIL